MADKIFLGHQPDALTLDGGEAAVGAAVAIVPHQEQMAGGHGHGRGIILGDRSDIEDRVALAAGKRFLEALVAALTLAVRADLGERHRGRAEAPDTLAAGGVLLEAPLAARIPGVAAVLAGPPPEPGPFFVLGRHITACI